MFKRAENNIDSGDISPYNPLSYTFGIDFGAYDDEIGEDDIAKLIGEDDIAKLIAEDSSGGDEVFLNMLKMLFDANSEAEAHDEGNDDIIEKNYISDATPGVPAGDIKLQFQFPKYYEYGENNFLSVTLHKDCRLCTASLQIDMHVAKRGKILPETKDEMEKVKIYHGFGKHKLSIDELEDKSQDKKNVLRISVHVVHPMNPHLYKAHFIDIHLFIEEVEGKFPTDLMTSIPCNWLGDIGNVHHQKLEEFFE